MMASDLAPSEQLERKESLERLRSAFVFNGCTQDEFLYFLIVEHADFRFGWGRRIMALYSWIRLIARIGCGAHRDRTLQGNGTVLHPHRPLWHTGLLQVLPSQRSGCAIARIYGHPIAHSAYGVNPKRTLARITTKPVFY